MAHPIGNLTVNSSVKCDTRKRVYSVVISVIHVYNSMQFPLSYTFLQCRYLIRDLVFLVDMQLSFYPYVNLRVCFQFSSFNKQGSIRLMHSTSRNFSFYYVPQTFMIF